MSKPDILSRMERDEELFVRDAQEPPLTGVGDGLELPQTHAEGGQESPQAPEILDQMEEALGGDKVPVEGDTGEWVPGGGGSSCLGLVRSPSSVFVRNEPLRGSVYCID